MPANAKIVLKRNISRRFLAGEEGFEPSAYGFGDRRSTPLYQLSYSPILFTDSKSKPNEAGLIWKGKGGCKYAIFAAISVTAETE